jgi:hypothetical protein
VRRLRLHGAVVLNERHFPKQGKRASTGKHALAELFHLQQCASNGHHLYLLGQFDGRHPGRHAVVCPHRISVRPRRFDYRFQGEINPPALPSIGSIPDLRIEAQCHVRPLDPPRAHSRAGDCRGAYAWGGFACHSGHRLSGLLPCFGGAWYSLRESAMNSNSFVQPWRWCHGIVNPNRGPGA